MRRTILALVLLSLSVGTSAGTHRALAGAGVKAYRSDLFGLQFSFDTELWGEHDGLGMGSVVVETSWVGGKHEEQEEEETLAQTTLVGGLRYTLNNFPHRNLKLYGRALAGGFWDLGVNGSSEFTGALGFGLDLRVSGFWGIRAQVDWYRLGGDTPEWYPQVSIGLVYHIPHFGSDRPCP